MMEVNCIEEPEIKPKHCEVSVCCAFGQDNDVLSSTFLHT